MYELEVVLYFTTGRQLFRMAHKVEIIPLSHCSDHTCFIFFCDLFVQDHHSNFSPSYTRLLQSLDRNVNNNNNIATSRKPLGAPHELAESSSSIVVPKAPAGTPYTPNTPLRKDKITGDKTGGAGANGSPDAGMLLCMCMSMHCHFHCSALLIGNSNCLPKRERPNVTS